MLLHGATAFPGGESQAKRCSRESDLRCTAGILFRRTNAGQHDVGDVITVQKSTLHAIVSFRSGSKRFAPQAASPCASFGEAPPQKTRRDKRKQNKTRRNKKKQSDWKIRSFRQLSADCHCESHNNSYTLLSKIFFQSSASNRRASFAHRKILD